MTKYIILLAIIVLANSCITEFQPSGTTAHTAMLVVDGTITDQLSTVRLSRSYAIHENFANNIPVIDARVWIETQGGGIRSAVVQPERGRYEITTGNLHPDSVYRLVIHWQDEEYVSDFLQPLITPPIDTIYYHKKNWGEPLQILVNSTNHASASPYYRWTFEEIWEFTAELYAMGRWDPEGDSIMIYDEREGIHNLVYHCWQRSRSIRLILESTLQLSENIVRNKKIHEIPASHKRISLLYFIEVTQYSLRQEAYDYFMNLQKNMDDMGSIFAPIPSELNGNIRNTKGDLPAIGFVDVSTSTTRKIFITREQAGYEPPGNSCEIITVNMPGYGYLHIDNEGRATSFAPYRCLDCTLNGGTKNKPDFWPNDHL
jgi:hypothetical protein